MMNRDVYFESVRASLFGGHLTQQQVDGQNAILDGWTLPSGKDLRWLGYMLATTYHETAQNMWPIEEYGHGAGQPYGVKDPETGQTYYGRGYVQLTWRENYQRATDELGLVGSDNLVWHAPMALDPTIAYAVMYLGMTEGWFRPPNCLSMFFNETKDDPYNAREIINGDKTLIPSWSGGVSIGNVIKGYYMKFTAALNEATIPPKKPVEISVSIATPKGVHVTFILNGQIVNA